MKAKNLIPATLIFILFFNGAAIAQNQLPKKALPEAQNTTALETVQAMYVAFGSGNMEALKETLAENTQWVYHGSTDIPYAGTYTGKEAVARFIMNIVSNVEILEFKPVSFISEGKQVVVIGSEKQKIKKNGQVLEQKWVQVYQVDNGLITSMEEFANTAHAAQKNA